MDVCGRACGWILTPVYSTTTPSTLFERYLVEFQDVFLESNPSSDVMWGVYYTECTVYSSSKLHNCIVNQMYRGHAARTVVIDDPVFSIVVPSLDNYYHTMVETLPKLLIMLAELRRAHQFQWLTGSLSKSIVLLAPDIPVVRKMVAVAGWPADRTRFLSTTEGVRYRLKRCFMIEFGPANPEIAAGSKWKPWRKTKKAPFAPW